jgi:uncharacterized protein (TIGR02117 family)
METRSAESDSRPESAGRFRSGLRRWLWRGVLAAGCVVLAMLLYVVAGVGLAWIPTNTDFRPDPDGIEIAVMEHGVHTDLVLPLRTAEHDWWELLSPEDFRGDVSDFRYVAFGWGDRDFYLETPTWADVRVTTVVKASMGLGSSTVHANLMYALPPADAWRRRIWVSSEQHDLLVEGIRDTLVLGADGRPVPIRGAHYHHADAFYEATGRYHLFRTCNVWVGDVLRAAGIRVGLWTPLPGGVLAQLP